MNTQTVNFKMPKELYDKLKAEAQKKNVSLAALIRLVCSEYLEKK